jgi:heat shock protein HtpX
MTQINGLHGHIERNTRATWLIIAGFGVAVCLCWIMACATVFSVTDWKMGGGGFGGVYSMRGDVSGFDDEVVPRKVSTASSAWVGPALDGARYALETMYAPVLIVVAWFLYFWFNNAGLMSRAMGARALSRFEDPKLFKVVENLSIQVGQPMPCIEVIDSPALNAYAHGWSPETATIGVTRGLLDTLPQRELEAVVAHEYTHILNRDSRVMIVATVFCGIFEELLAYFRSGITGAHERRPDGTMPFRKALHRIWYLPMTVPLFGGLCVCLAACWVPTLLGRAMIARSREFLADAGAVELTKDADALVSALRRLSQADNRVDVAPMYQAMMIFGSARGLFASHPSVDERIAALRAHAGATSVDMRRPARVTAPVQSRPRRGQSSAFAVRRKPWSASSWPGVRPGVRSCEIGATRVESPACWISC